MLDQTFVVERHTTKRNPNGVLHLRQYRRSYTLCNLETQTAAWQRTALSSEYLVQETDKQISQNTAPQVEEHLCGNCYKAMKNWWR